MRNLRLKILFVLILTSLGLVIYALIMNTKQVDFFITKNLHYHSRILHGLEDINNADSIKAQVIPLIENLDNSRIENNDKAIKVLKTLGLIVIMILFTLILLIIEIRRKTPYNKRS